LFYASCPCDDEEACPLKSDVFIEDASFVLIIISSTINGEFKIDANNKHSSGSGF
jgi:hypothetical protein